MGTPAGHNAGHVPTFLKSIHSVPFFQSFRSRSVPFWVEEQSSRFVPFLAFLVEEQFHPSRSVLSQERFYPSFRFIEKSWFKSKKKTIL